MIRSGAQNGAMPPNDHEEECRTRFHDDGMARFDGLKHDDGGRHLLEKMALAGDGAPFRHPDFPRRRLR